MAVASRVLRACSSVSMMITPNTMVASPCGPNQPMNRRVSLFSGFQ